MTFDPTAYGPPPRRRTSWLADIAVVVIAVLLGAGAGYLAGHNAGPRGVPGVAGERGPVGPQGPPGLAGAVGAAGAAGSAAAVTDLGVCWSDYVQTNTNTLGQSVSWITSVSITSPAKHADGTTYCPYGNYVAVSPQKAG